MARNSLSDKVTRVIKLLTGLRNKRIATALAAHGFTHAELQEGWSLVQAATRPKHDGLGASMAGADTIAKLDAWENRWFPIADATLARRFPGVHAQFFAGLAQTTGPAVIVGVRTFVERFDAMAKGDGAYGVEGPMAKEALEKRGFTASVMNEARALLDTMHKTEADLETLTVEEEKAERAKAEADLWAWYLEWSKIARSAVTQPALLRQLGFGQSRRMSAMADIDEDGENGENEEDVEHATGVITTPFVSRPVTPITPVTPVGPVVLPKLPGTAAGPPSVRHS